MSGIEYLQPWDFDRLTRGRDLTDAEIDQYLADRQTALRHATARVGDEIAEKLRDRLRDVNDAAAHGPTPAAVSATLTRALTEAEEKS